MESGGRQPDDQRAETENDEAKSVGANGRVGYQSRDRKADEGTPESGAVATRRKNARGSAAVVTVGSALAEHFHALRLTGCQSYSAGLNKVFGFASLPAARQGSVQGASSVE
jgi:hypothetical protein